MYYTIISCSFHLGALLIHIVLLETHITVAVLVGVCEWWTVNGTVRRTVVQLSMVSGVL